MYSNSLKNIFQQQMTKKGLGFSLVNGPRSNMNLFLPLTFHYSESVHGSPLWKKGENNKGR